MLVSLYYGFKLLLNGGGDEDQGSKTSPRLNGARQGLGGPMTRTRTKKAQEPLDQEVNYFLSRALGKDVNFPLSPRPNPEKEPKLLQLIQLKEEPNEGIDLNSCNLFYKVLDNFFYLFWFRIFFL